MALSDGWPYDEGPACIISLVWDQANSITPLSLSHHLVGIIAVWVHGEKPHERRGRAGLQVAKYRLAAGLQTLGLVATLVGLFLSLPFTERLLNSS